MHLFMFLNLFIYLFIYLFIFGCVGSSFLCEGFLWLWRAGATLHRGRGPLTVVASLVVEHRLQTRRLSSCGSRAQLLRGMWDLPRPGLEPVSSALAGGFSTTAPPGKPWQEFLWKKGWERFETEEEKTQMQRRRPCRGEGRGWSYATTAKKCLGPSKAGRGKWAFFPRAFGGSREHCPADTLTLNEIGRASCRERV